MSEFDVVILGAGIGGLSAAAHLVSGGMRPLVIERYSRLGGRCSSLDFRGYHIPTGAISVEVGGPFQEAFTVVDAPFDVAQPDPQVRYLIKGDEVTIPPGGGGLRTTIRAAAANNAEADAVLDAFARALRWSPPAPGISLRAWLTQYTDNENILGIFRSVIPAMTAVNDHEMPATEFIRFITDMGGYRSYGYARPNQAALMGGLGDAVERLGGKVIREAQVTAINATRQGVGSVTYKTKQGEIVTVDAPVVVSNLGPNATVRLTSDGAFEPAYLDYLHDTVKPGVPGLALFFRSQKPLMSEPGIFMPTNMRRVCVMGEPSRLVPNLAPKGWHLTEVVAAPQSSEQPVDWKEEIELSLLDMADLFPDFSPDMLLTTLKYSGEWPVIRTWPGSEVAIRSGVPNLFLVGDACEPAGYNAIPAAAESGKRAAIDILGMRHLTTERAAS